MESENAETQRLIFRLELLERYCKSELGYNSQTPGNVGRLLDGFANQLTELQKTVDMLQDENRDLRSTIHGNGEPGLKSRVLLLEQAKRHGAWSIQVASGFITLIVSSIVTIAANWFRG